MNRPVMAPFALAALLALPVTVETGGFLGMGEREIVIGMGQLQARGGNLVTTLSSEELKGLPDWKETKKR